MVGRVAREARQLEESEDQEIKMIIFRGRTKGRDKRKQLITEAIQRSTEERDKAFMWIVDYKKMTAAWIKKDYCAQRLLLPKKYQ